MPIIMSSLLNCNKQWCLIYYLWVCEVLFTHAGLTVSILQFYVDGAIHQIEALPTWEIKCMEIMHRARSALLQRIKKAGS